MTTVNVDLELICWVVVVVVVVFTLKAVPVSTRYFLPSVLVQPTRTPSVVTGYINYPERVHIPERNKKTQKSQHTRDYWKIK